jgi:hypothetical protein
MQQLIIDIPSDKDALLIKALMKKFKGVDVNSFSPSTTLEEMQSRIEKGLQQADAGNVKSWKSVKNNLLKRINAEKK